VLIRFIPADAPRPISPARVQDVARELGIDPRTVRNHVKRLIALGLAADRCGDGGHRRIHRSGGRIVVLAGIDLGPMLARRAELEAEAARLRAEDEEHTALRAEITQARRRFRLLCPLSSSGVSERAWALFAELPRRYGHLPVRDLLGIRDRLRKLFILIEPLECDPENLARPASTRTAPCPPELPTGRDVLADQSEKIGRPNLTKDSKDSGTRELVPILDLLPAVWRSDCDEAEQRSSTALTAVAHTRSISLGIPKEAWDAAVTNLGPRQAALLTLAAGSAAIRCPAAWMRAMTKRGVGAPLDLSRNLLALKRRRAAPAHHHLSD
jgi:transposase-like protein